MNKEIEVLVGLIEFSKPRVQIEANLRVISWDSDDELLMLTVSVTNNVLQRYQNGKIKAKDIEWWSNAIECRDQIGFEDEHKDTISEIITMLANPTLYHYKSYSDLADEACRILLNI
ncbi:hypothetical protein [Kordiimonas aquimaris]|uniref:hypothetical protein n=1 Tax=Kordiimonas aquimaris TaxID=707591 RepID=UPI0021CE9402|nr:hypothetical protein [Kordiimonas aquimaris]